jgi:glycosyltransferase involved in cell wall biosynthesis
VSRSLSVVVVAHDMARELPRTLRTLAPTHPRGVEGDDYEVIVVDNGSPEPIDEEVLASFPGHLRSTRIDPAPSSPAHAANVGLSMAEGDVVGLVVDGARMASPGLLATARLVPRPVVVTLGWHLGDVRHIDAGAAGHDQAAEDALLADLGWEEDGYRLFDVATLANSSGRGWFGPIGESSAIFLHRSSWDELGGLDERFVLPGGGLVNHDLLRRATALDGGEVVMLLGEGTFHQYHGGAATSGRFGWDEMHAEYVTITGAEHRPPPIDPLYLGHVPPSALPHLRESVRLAEARRARR